MTKLTPEGERLIAALANRYSISIASAQLMLDAVARGGGSMAQFNVPEFGGGQWMRGGMTMVGDMFNNALKATVDNLCNELSNLLTQPNIFEPIPAPLPPQFQQQSQGGSGVSYQSSFQSGSWWPTELGSAASTGSQNNLRYAYFPNLNRLAIDDGGHIEIYDTTGYDIGGFGQQQGSGSSLTFSSYRGTVRVDDLPRVTAGASSPAPQNSSPQSAAPQSPVAAQPEAPAASFPSGSDANSILALIEQLNQLREKGILTEEEFTSKKAELLKRL